MSTQTVPSEPRKMLDTKQIRAAFLDARRRRAQKLQKL
jgi:hypothetical protein